VNQPARLDYRLCAALGASLAVHAAAMLVSLPAPRFPILEKAIALHVRLVELPTLLVEASSPAPRQAKKSGTVKRARPKDMAPTPPAPVAEQTFAAPPPAATSPSSPEPVAPEPATTSVQPPPETVALVAPPPPPQTGPSAELLSRYTKSLSDALARYKEYPRVAELRGWEGSVTMRLRVAPSGRLLEAAVYQSSGYEALDKQAITMVSKAGVLPVPPQGLDLAEVPVLVPINFRLER